MTNPCYDFALRPHPHSNIPNSYIERRHEPKRAPSPASPSSPDSLDDFDNNHKIRQRGDRGRWKTDGTVNIAEVYEDSKPQSSSCQCPNCACNRESAFQDSDPSPSRRPKSSRGFSGGNDGGGGGLDQQDNRKHPPPVPRVNHSLWNPLQLLRRSHTSSQRERDREPTRPNTSSCAYSFPRPNSSRSGDVCWRREAYSPNRSPSRSSKVRTLRRVPQQTRLPPRKSPNRCGSSKIPSPISRSSRRRFHHIQTSPPPPWRQTLDIACQTRREEFPMTPEETPKASPVRRVIASDSVYHDRPLSARPFSCPAVQRRPSPCRCSAASPAVPRHCCSGHCVGWQERTPCSKSVVVPAPMHQGNHHGYADCHHVYHHGVCLRAAEPIRTGQCCSKCHQPLPVNK